MSIEVMKQAEKLLVSYQDYTENYRIANECGVTITALRQAIEQAELAKPEQEPVAYVDDGNLFWHEHVLSTYAAEMHGKDLFVAPPKREWVGLTQEDRDDLLNYATTIPSRIVDRTEAKLKEKNT